MKKLSTIMLAAACIVLASCQKDPDTDKLDNHYLVYTNYDSGTDFNAIESFYVIDSILIIGNSEKPTYWNNNNSQQIINAYSDKLEGSLISASVILLATWRMWLLSIPTKPFRVPNPA